VWRQVLMMSHDRVEGLEPYKKRYETLQVHYKLRVKEIEALQQKVVPRKLAAVIIIKHASVVYFSFWSRLGIYQVLSKHHLDESR
jgi:hypothetical protein